MVRGMDAEALRSSLAAAKRNRLAAAAARRAAAAKAKAEHDRRVEFDTRAIASLEAANTARNGGER